MLVRTRANCKAFSSAGKRTAFNASAAIAAARCSSTP